MPTPRFYGPGSAGPVTSSLNSIYDPSQVSTDGGTTGMWRAYSTTDAGGARAGTVSNYSVSGIANGGWGTPLPDNPLRKAWFVQNLSTGVLFVKMGTNVNSGSMNFTLKGCTIQNDGLGASWSDAPATYTGPVSITGYFNTTPTYIAWEL